MCMYICVYAYIYICVCVCVCMCVSMCVYVCVYDCISVCMYVCMHECVYVRVYVCTCITAWCRLYSTMALEPLNTGCIMYCVASYEQGLVTCSSFFLYKLILPQPVEQLPAFCGTPSFSTVLSRSCHLYLS